MKKNKKKVIIYFLLTIVIVILAFIGIKGAISYKEEKERKELSDNYNDKQKECNIVGLTNNYIYVTRHDKDGKAVQGSKWKVTNMSGEEIGTFETNQNGNGGIVGLENGEYYAQEIFAPENCDKKDYRNKFVISNYDTSYWLRVSDCSTDGALFLVLKDKDGNPLSGKKYNVYTNGDEFIITITTNAKGLAGVINVSDGIYYVKEADKENAEKHYTKVENMSVGRIDITYVD